MCYDSDPLQLHTKLENDSCGLVTKLVAVNVS